MNIYLFFKNFFYKKTIYTSYDYLVARYILYIGFFLFIRTSDFTSYSGVPHELWEPHGLFRILGLSLPSKDVLFVLETLWKISFITSAVGLLGRFSIITTFSLSFFILGLSKGFITSDFHFHLPVLVMGILCFSDIHRCSVGSLSSPNNKSDDDTFLDHWVYNLVLFCIVMMYFSAGWSKLRLSGLSWVTEEYFTKYIFDAQRYFPHETSKFAKSIATYIGSHSSLGQFLGIVVLAIELSSPIVMVKRAWTLYYFVVWIVFHLSIYFLMGIYSSIWFIPVFMMFVPWSRLSTNVLAYFKKMIL